MEKSKDSFTSMSKYELRSSIQLELKKTGIVSSITSTMREEVIKALHLNSPPVLRRDNTLKRNTNSIEQMALRSLVLEYLALDGLDNTKSVFVSESGLDERVLSTEDSLKAYGIRIGSQAYRCMVGPGPFSRNETVALSIPIYSSTFHKLLYNFAEQLATPCISKDNVSTQTETAKSQTLQARVELDRQLTQIEEKFQHPDRVNHSPTRTIPQAKLFAYQKQSEEHAKKVMLQKLEDFKIKEIAQMRLVEAQKRENDVNKIRCEEEAKYKLKLEYINNKQGLVQKDYDLKHKELILVYHQSKQELHKEIEDFKRRDKEMKRILDVDKERLKLEDEKVKRMLAAAEAKFKVNEERESEVKANIDLEYDKVHAAARKSYHAATEVLKNQSELYTKELMGLNSYRKTISEDMNKSLRNKKRVNDLLIERDNLKKNLNRVKLELRTFREEAKDNKKRELDILSASQERMKQVELRASELESEVERYRKKNSTEQKIHMNEKGILEEKVENLLKESKTSISIRRKLSLEKDLISEELVELRKLFRESQETISCMKRSDIGCSVNVVKSQIGNVYDHQRKEQNKIKSSPFLFSRISRDEEVDNQHFLRNIRDTDVVNHIPWRTQRGTEGIALLMESAKSEGFLTNEPTSHEGEMKGNTNLHRKPIHCSRQRATSRNDSSDSKTCHTKDNGRINTTNVDISITDEIMLLEGKQVIVKPRKQSTILEKKKEYRNDSPKVKTVSEKETVRSFDFHIHEKIERPRGRSPTKSISGTIPVVTFNKKIGRDDKSISSFATSITWDQDGEGEISKLVGSSQQPSHDTTRKNVDVKQKDIAQGNLQVKKVDTLKSSGKETSQFEKSLCPSVQGLVESFYRTVDIENPFANNTPFNGSKRLDIDQESVPNSKGRSDHKNEANTCQRSSIELNSAKTKVDTSNSNLPLPKSEAASETECQLISAKEVIWRGSEHKSDLQSVSGGSASPTESQSSRREGTSHSTDSRSGSNRNQVHDRDETNNDDEDSYGSSEFDEETVTVVETKDQSSSRQIKDSYDDESHRDSSPIVSSKSHSSLHQVRVPWKDTKDTNKEEYDRNDFPVSTSSSASIVPIDMTNCSIAETSKNGDSSCTSTGSSTCFKDTHTEQSNLVTSSVSSTGIEVSKPTFSNPNVTNWW